MSQLIQFRWPVPINGYRWQDGRTADSDDIQMFLVQAASQEQVPEATHKEISLREHSGLFRIFADTDPTADSILGFTNRYGELGVGTDFWSIEQHRSAFGEALTRWRTEILAMRKTIRFWELARDGDIEELARDELIERVNSSLSADRAARGLSAQLEDARVYTRFSTAIAAMGFAEPRIVDLAKPANRIDLAMSLVQHLVNTHLAGHVSPQMYRKDRGTAMELRLLPTSLLSAMWLQFALAVVEDKNYRRCDECSTWFEVHPRAAKRTRLFCSDACRVKAHRRRQAEAQMLYHTGGLTVEQIAERLETETGTVERWIKLPQVKL